jgi:hypothetical protein
MIAAMRQPWIHSAAIDVTFILAPGLVVSAISLGLLGMGHGGAGLSLWMWGLLIVGIDVAHVYSTIYRTYLDPIERPRLASWLILTPLVGWVLGVLVYSASAAAFWTALAYLAVFHFVRQQYGFLMIYSRGERELPVLCAWIDQCAVYAATLGPLVYWHAHLPRRFVWFIEGDFLPLPGWMWTAVAPVYAGLMVAYVIKECWLCATHRRFNVPRNAIVIGTVVSWFVGIIAASGDLVFTMTNVVAHGIPYMALTFIFVEGREREERQAGEQRHRRARRSAGVFLWSLPLAIGALLVLAFVEEGLWDGLVWREHLALFPGFASLPAIESDTWLGVVVPLLAVPQLTHYVIDGVIWRLKHHPEWRRTLFWRAAPAVGDA